MSPIIAIRPEPGLSRTLASARKLGLLIEAAPLFQVDPLGWDPPRPGDFDALLLGSGNSVNQAGENLELYRNLPVHAVGEETARAAREAGFTVARTGQGGLQVLLDEADQPRRYLRLAGRAHIPLDPPPGSTIATCVVYDTRPLPMPPALAATLAQGALVMLHSAEAARHFAGECDRLALSRANVALAALAPRIAAAAGQGWKALESAENRTDCALLALVRDMCH